MITLTCSICNITTDLTEVIDSANKPDIKEGEWFFNLCRQPSSPDEDKYPVCKKALIEYIDLEYAKYVELLKEKHKGKIPEEDIIDTGNTGNTSNTGSTDNVVVPFKPVNKG